MKDWRSGGIGVGGSPLVDNNSTKERRGFLERRRLGEDLSTEFRVGDVSD